ncbi:ATP synthase subunit d, mitochondrial [Ambystoma mexicanum]|uniref:ATP synthase subunit d, mitochondrial n=1 Tax=Ambystoma mexicanum TaxID=8296 RepID=UPI0037E98DAC
MASRRAAVKAIDWLAFAERVPANQKAMFVGLKARSDNLAARLSVLPEKPPTIDWAYYRTAIARAGMVDEFEKKFSALKVPEPIDTQTDKINAQENESSKQAVEYIQASKSRVSQYEKELELLNSMIPWDQMTIEDLHAAFPETKTDQQKNPYWPHKPVTDL